MLSGAFLVIAAFAAAAALTRAVSVLRTPGAPVASFLLGLLGAACFALSRYFGPARPPGGAAAPLLADMVMMTMVFAALSLLFFLSQPLSVAWPRAAHRLAALGACAAGMIVCFTLLPPANPQGLSPDDTLIQLGYFTLYAVFLASSLTEVLILAWQHAGLPWHRPFRHAGLLLTCAGAITGLAGLAGQTGLAAIGLTHMAPPPLTGTAACPGLAASPWCAFAATLPAAVALAAAGAALPVLAAAGAAAWRSWCHLQMYRTLEPLWERLQFAFPQIVLPEHGGRSRPDLTFRLYRRVIEVDDGCVLLRPYMRPGVAAAAARAAAGYGLRGDALRATVEAAEIAAALRAHRAASTDDRPPPDHANSDVTALDQQTVWLTKVARAYATSPLVYQLVTRHG